VPPGRLLVVIPQTGEPPFKLNAPAVLSNSMELSPAATVKGEPVTGAPLMVMAYCAKAQFRPCQR
jgi:hypothetical protein